MFAALFEVRQKTTHWDLYLGTAKMLRPELENIDGFVYNIRYRSLTLGRMDPVASSWRDEKALVRWRTKMRHHQAQEKGRAEILADYHLRVGQVTRDTRVPAGQVIHPDILRTGDTPYKSQSTTSHLDGSESLTISPGSCSSSQAMTPDSSPVAKWRATAARAPGPADYEGLPK